MRARQAWPLVSTDTSVKHQRQACGDFSATSTGWAPCSNKESSQGDDDLPARIAALERQLAELRVQLDAQMLAGIVAVVRSGVAFSANELWRHRRVAPALQTLFDEVLRIGSARRLGKRLQRMQGRDLGGFKLIRVGDDHNGAIWTVTVCSDCH